MPTDSTLWMLDILPWLVITLQDLYLSILRKRGQLVVGPGGGQTLVSYPQVNHSYEQCVTELLSGSDQVPEQPKAAAGGLGREGEDLA